MEALQFDPQKKTLSLVKTDLPAIVEKHEVIVKVVYSGLCGTDLHIIDGHFPCKDRKFILGHEFCGIASSIGSEVKHIKRGDRVVVDPNSGCGFCSLCHSARYHLCAAGGYNNNIGIYVDGGWAQFCKVPAAQVQRIPDGVTFQQAVLCEPLSCIYHGLDKISPLPIGTSILISGAGIIGNLWITILHHMGHRKVTVCEPVQGRRDLIEKLNTGFKCVSPEELKAMKQADPQWGVDLCIDCSGNTRAIQQGLELLNIGGKLCIFGVAPPDATISVSPFLIYKKELTVVGVLINPFSFPNTISIIEAMGSRYLDLQKLGVKVVPLDQYQQAISELKKGGISKVVFKLSPGPD